MDAPRRWQVVSLATAVVSMGLGGLAMGRSTTEAVPPIELQVVTGVPAHVPADGETRPDELELVPPGVVEVASAPSPDSVDSPETPAGEPDAPASVHSPAAPDSSDPAASVHSPGSPASPESVQSPESASSVGSPDSVSSPG